MGSPSAGKSAVSNWAGVGRRGLGLALVGGEGAHEADEVGNVGGRGLADLEVGHDPILAPAAPVAQSSAGRDLRAGGIAGEALSTRVWRVCG